MTATFIKKALEYRHSRDFFLCEVKTGPTWEGLGKIDAWAMAKSWANPRVLAYEIKVNRSDFLSDNKWMKYLPFCNEFYFACPKDLIKEKEVPDKCGLVYISDKGRVRTVIKAKYHDEIDKHIFLYILMNRIKSDCYPFHKDGREYLKDWLKNKDEDKSLSLRVSSTLIKRLSEATSELEKFKSTAQDFYDIRDMLEKEDVEGWSIASKIENLIEKSKTKDADKIKKLRKLFEEMHDSFREIVNK